MFPSEPETCDHLAGDWRIYQLKYGHRFSADDVLTAWTAARALPTARRLLDLGCGIGSVGFLTLWRLGSEAHLTAVEVQPVSLALAQRTAALNGFAHRVDLHLGDLRELQLPGRFELITGSPPYFPVGKALVSPHPQRAAARMELHGDVRDYCRAAAGHLEPSGRFVFVHAAGDQRPEEAITQAGMRLLARQEVVVRPGRTPLIALFTCAFEGERVDPAPFVVRDASNRWTEQYLAMRREMGTVLEAR
ncbi:MAG: hypothetical protein AMXMBFR33_22980 [Candidatus Xenobia bacterium]